MDAQQVKNFLGEFQRRYHAQDIESFLKKLADQRVLVIGDLIIDEYHYCKPLGMSGKEAILSVNYENEASFVGGAAATANHVANFCKEVGLFTLLGRQNPQEKLVRRGLRANVTPYFAYRNDAPTVVIRRYLEKAFLKKYFQLYFHNPFVPQELDGEIAGQVKPLLSQYDVVLVNDFGLGFLGPQTIETICQNARFLALNTQTNSSNRGFNPVTKYPRADYFCIDEPEIRLATHQRHTPMEVLVRDIARKVNAEKGSVTLGHLGAMTYDVKQDEVYTIPVLSQKVVDRVGAGDAYFSITAPLVASGVPMDAVGFIGNVVGAIAVTIVGNERSVDHPEVTQLISTFFA
ncbi:MAG: hypothetical protein HYS57_02920 [Parcubacteria group bacterium]|nr:hypothetical protein [Parcubacteria group bacterium]